MFKTIADHWWLIALRGVFAILLGAFQMGNRRKEAVV